MSRPPSSKLPDSLILSPTLFRAPTPPPIFAASFAAVAANQDDRVTVPEGYTVDVLLKAGDSVETGTPYSGSFPASPAVAEKWAGGGHDGMEYLDRKRTRLNSSH